MAIPLPALDVRPPQPPDMLAQYSKLVALKNLIAQQPLIQQEQQRMELTNQGLGLSNQQVQLQLQQQQAMANALKQSQGDQPSPSTSASQAPVPGTSAGSGSGWQTADQLLNGASPAATTSAAPPSDVDPLAGIEQVGINAMRNGAGEYGLRFLQGITGLRKTMADANEARANTKKAEQAIHAGSLDALANGASAVLASGNDPRVVDTFLGVMGNFLPNEAANLRVAFQSNPSSIGPTMQAFRAYSTQQLQAVARQGQANKPTAASLAVGAASGDATAQKALASLKGTSTAAKPTAGMVNGTPQWGVWTGNGWSDVHGSPLPNFQPQPNFSETGLFTPVTESVNGKLVQGLLNERTGQISAAPSIIPKDVNTQIQRSLESARSADTRYRVMADNEAPALNGNQQAQLNIVANHIGMTLGMQKGARINQAVWDEAVKTAPILGRIKSRFDNNGYLSGVTLTPQQVKQMVELGLDRRVREWQQAADAASQNGVSISGELPEDVRRSLAGKGPVSPIPIGAAPQTAPAAIKIGQVEDGWKFMGGDPASQTSWRKVGK